MNSKDMMLEVMRQQGRTDALDLRGRAADLDGTAIIREERKIPHFDPTMNYTTWPVGAPVRDREQVYTLLQPHDALSYQGRPKDLPSLWSITHTKDPDRAKPYLPPNGTSGLYMLCECCTKGGAVWMSSVDNNAYPPGEVGTEPFWENLTEEEENA